MTTTEQLNEWRHKGEWDKVNKYMCEHAKDDKELQALVKRLEEGVVKQWNEQICENTAKVVVPGVSEGVSAEVADKELFKLKQYEDCTLLLVVGYEDYWKGSWFLGAVVFNGENNISQLYFD